MSIGPPSGGAKLTSAFGTGINSIALPRKAAQSVGGRSRKQSRRRHHETEICAPAGGAGRRRGDRSARRPRSAQDKEPYVIYLSNNFVGNDWRQQMQRVAEVSVNKGPLAGRSTSRSRTSRTRSRRRSTRSTTSSAQKPDAILVDAASDTALNPTIKRACDAGIVVISFDQMVTEPCAYAVASDWDMIPAVLAEWMVEQLGGKGNVIVDRGLAGAPISAQLQGGYEKVLAKYPDIEVVGYYNGDYALGPEQSGVAALLAANPQVDGILTQGYGSGAIQALKDAGRPIVPVIGFSYNVSALTCAQTEGAKCILGSNPAYLSSEAIKLAVEILDTGKQAGRARHRGQGRLRHHRSLRVRSSIPTPRCRRSSSARTPSPTSRRA